VADEAARQGASGEKGDPAKGAASTSTATEATRAADPTDDLGDYPRVVEAASGRPVLVRGGGRASDEEILERSRRVMAAGASGLVYGRNVIQHEDPAGMVQRLMAIVHG